VNVQDTKKATKKHYFPTTAEYRGALWNLHNTADCNTITPESPAFRPENLEDTGGRGSRKFVLQFKNHLQDAAEVDAGGIQAEGGQAMVIGKRSTNGSHDRRATVRARPKRNATRKAAAFALTKKSEELAMITLILTTLKPTQHLKAIVPKPAISQQIKISHHLMLCISG
jgi:hypothetical protein